MVQFVKKLSRSEIWGGFLRVSKKNFEELINLKGKAAFIINNKKYILNYNKKSKRVFGLTKIYAEIKPMIGDELKISIEKTTT